MKILVIVHQFLPADSAGTEVYTYKLAKALQERGHELLVYTTARDAARDSYTAGRRIYGGLDVFEVVHNHDFGDFRGVYKNALMEGHLRDLLDEFDPDLVHVQHLHLHSVDYPRIVAERGVPVAYTLADYLVICPRSWLVKLDFSLCGGPEPRECARCSVIWPRPRKSQAEGDIVPLPAQKWQREPRPRYSVRRFFGKVRRRLDTSSYVEAVEQRRREHEQALAHVDLFIAPSRFLRDRFVEAGMVAAERIVYSDYGFDHSPFAGAADRERGPRGAGPLRVGFIGSIAEQKGVHVLVDAVNGIDDGGVECLIHGDLSSFPNYAGMVRKKSGGTLRFMGRYDNDQIAAVMEGMDVLVVPSRWYENSPLTIHEAFMAGVPVITGDRGGMAELVEHEVGGLQFRIGDAADLRRQILRLRDEPGLLDRLRASIPEVKDIAQDANELEARFQELVELARARSGASGTA